MAASMSNFLYSSSRTLKIFTHLPLGCGMPRAFGDYVLAKCESRKWSMRELASAFDRKGNQDTVVSHLSKMINGRIKPKPKHVEQLADALRMDGPERETFLFLGLLAACPEKIEEKFFDLERRLGRLEGKK
jgi:hypothetical protein